jgi:RNAse (barnase) inhibitor barstar
VAPPGPPRGPRRAAPPAAPARAREATLDGRRCTSLEAFYAEVGRALCGGAAWGESIEALGEVLRGGWGPEPVPLRLVWRDAERARRALDHAEAARALTRRLRDCPPNVLIKTAWALRAALRGEGPTAFDWVLAAVAARPNVELVLR